MAVDFKKARDFVYANGVLWERALFAYLFEEGSLERLQQCIACYRNPDGGFGHAIEHDIRTPESHPLALEYILTVFARDVGIPPGNLFDGAADWVQVNRNEDGSLKNPASVLTYPHAPWWTQGGQTIPDSITGNLLKLGKASPGLLAHTKHWVAQNLTIEKIRETDWLFMAYHAYDYFFNVDDFPNVEQYRQVTVAQIGLLAEKAPEKQYGVVFTFAPTPESRVAQAFPEIIERDLDYLMETQQVDGHWMDEHALSQWFPMTTILTLLHLKNFGRITI